MQNFRITSSNFPYLFSGLFIVISTVFLIIAFLSGYSVIKIRTSSDAYTIASRVETNSHVSSGERMYSPVFFYNVDDKEYSCSTGISYSSKPKINNNKIYYESQNPENCISEYDFIQGCILAGLFFIVALPIFIIGLLMLICVTIGRVKIKRLRRCGQLIKDVPCRIIPSNATLNNRQGYIIEVEYQGLRLTSGPKFDIDARRDSVDLLIDPLNPKNYLIDFDMT